MYLRIFYITYLDSFFFLKRKKESKYYNLKYNNIRVPWMVLLYCRLYYILIRMCVNISVCLFKMKPTHKGIRLYLRGLVPFLENKQTKKSTS